MGIIRISALFMVLLVIIGGCNESEKYKRFEGWESEFECEIFWQEGDGKYRAKILMDGINDEKRKISVSFFEPDTLSGVNAEIVDGVTKISLGDITAYNVKLSGIFDIAELFEGGKILSRESISLGGEKCEILYIETDNGEKRKICISEKGMPQKIQGTVNGREIELEVIWFEKRGN
jgi:hypothetical protein